MGSKTQALSSRLGFWFLSSRRWGHGDASLSVAAHVLQRWPCLAVAWSKMQGGLLALL